LDVAGLDLSEERFFALVETEHLTIERIVSVGQASPPGFWYDQERAEWVTVLTGSAGVRFHDEADARVLGAGDCLLIAARRKHRVEWTDPDRPTIWLAVHFS
jgi:cupin 2 domain-containing protein